MVAPQYLLDANTLSEALRLSPDPAMLSRLAANRPHSATAAVVIHEMRYGAYRLPPSRRRRTIERYLDRLMREGMPILPYDEAAAEWHARERARLVAIGRTPPFFDGQIAAVAAVNDLVLVTSNVRDFHAFRDLRVEDWRA